MFASDTRRQPRRGERRDEGRRHAWNNNDSQRFSAHRSNSHRNNRPSYQQPPPRSDNTMRVNSSDSWSIASNDGSTRGPQNAGTQQAAPNAASNTAPAFPLLSGLQQAPNLAQQALMTQLLQNMQNWTLSNPFAVMQNMVGGYGQNQPPQSNQGFSHLVQPPQQQQTATTGWQRQQNAAGNRRDVPVNADGPGPLHFNEESDIGKMQKDVYRLYSLSNSLQKKKCYAIIERLPEKPDEDTDQAYIRRTVYPVISSPQFRGHSDPVEMYRLGEPRDSRQNNDGYEPKPRVVRVVFDTQQAAQTFVRLFRRCTAETFQDLERKPFASRDLTPPELQLQRALRKYCWEKNREAGRYVYRYSNLRVYNVERSDDSP